MPLPENVAATYPDRSAGDTAHQGHHDTIHNAVNAIDAAYAAAQTAGFTGTKQAWLEQIQASARGVRAHKSVAQTISATTFTKVTYDTEVYDDIGGYAPATSTFTAQSAGIHLVSARIDALVADAQRLIVMVYVNGVDHSRLADQTEGATSDAGRGGTVPIKLALNDTVEIYAYSSAAEDIRGGSHLTYFSVVKL